MQEITLMSWSIKSKLISTRGTCYRHLTSQLSELQNEQKTELFFVIKILSQDLFIFSCETSHDSIEKIAFLSYIRVLCEHVRLIITNQKHLSLGDDNVDAYIINIFCMLFLETIALLPIQSIFLCYKFYKLLRKQGSK